MTLWHENTKDESTMMRRLAEHTSNIVIFMGVTSKCAGILSNAEKQTLEQRSLSFLRRQETRQCPLDSHFRENEGQG